MANYVFPQSKPIGVNSSTSREAIRDSAAFPTKVIDYLKLDIFNHEDNTAEDTIFLYLPETLSEAYTAKWEGIELGAAGAAAMNAARGIVDEKGIGEGFSEQLKKFAESAKPGLGFKAAAGAIEGVVGLTGAAGGGGGIDSNTLAQMTTGKVFNPYEEAVYKGGSFRPHDFTFHMVPKNSADVIRIYEIIHKLRLAMLPGKDKNMWLTLPNFFRCQIVRYTDAGGGKEDISNPETGGAQGVLSALMQFPTKMVLKGMSVTPEKNLTLQSRLPGKDLADFGPVSYTMSLKFMETAYLTKETFTQPQDRSGGFFNFESADIPEFDFENP
tara:strand:- start:921 stop:1901 length:981 start_codon:yes stop_codon:yes gene_type:complete